MNGIMFLSLTKSFWNLLNILIHVLKSLGVMPSFDDRSSIVVASSCKSSFSSAPLSRTHSLPGCLNNFLSVYSLYFPLLKDDDGRRYPITRVQISHTVRSSSLSFGVVTYRHQFVRSYEHECNNNLQQFFQNMKAGHSCYETQTNDGNHQALAKDKLLAEQKLEFSYDL